MDPSDHANAADRNTVSNDAAPIPALATGTAAGGGLSGSMGALSMRLRRDGGAVGGAVRRWWNTMWTRRWFRWLTGIAGTGLVLMLLLYAMMVRDLPSVERLVTYEPPLPTIVRDVDGDPVHSYARERRVQLDFEEFPKPLVNAFLAAEDKTFFSHGGLDYPGIVSAMITNITNSGRPVGASTITQQVAKNLLLTNEVSYTRKLREAILARRIEGALDKPAILSLYLNAIPLGRRSFGVQAASLAYFGKDVADLALHEMAFLAILPKAPETYGRAGNEARAIERRNFVLGEMERNGFITRAQRDAARTQPLGLVTGDATQFAQVGGYYMEEVRRLLIDRFGEGDTDGPNSIYAGGLWVRTGFDAAMQDATQKALRGGMQRYDAGKGWSGPIATIEPGASWASQLRSSARSIAHENWRVGAVIEKAGGAATIGFADGTTARLPSGNAGMRARRTGGTAFAAMKPGDLIVVAPAGNQTVSLRNIPEVSGGMIAQSTHSGRVHAMQGGFDAGLSSFNRATQAERQPGSTIKPFVYAAALDNGMTPASTIIDGSFCVYQGARLGRKCFTNFGGARGAGAQTMRWGLEQSRNLMTVRAANQVGMDPVVKTIRAAGIGDHPPFLSTALGSGSTTVARLTNAYAMLVNHGRQLEPKLIDMVQDRRGRVIWPARWTPCSGCNARDWDGKAMPRFAPEGAQKINPLTAYQVVHMLEGVIERGTATTLRDLAIPLFGKTGTTTGPKDVWFVGGSPDVVAGVYMGFDQPRDMGGYVQGGSVAAPMFKSFGRAVFKDAQPLPFIAPEGVRMVRIDRRTGRRVFGSWPSDDPKAAIIWEAFKPETEPRRSIRQDEIEARGPATRARSSAPVRRATQPAARPATPSPRRDSDFLEQGGGIY